MRHIRTYVITDAACGRARAGITVVESGIRRLRITEVDE
jgi:hypothetical protein